MQKIKYPLIVSDFDGTLVRADGSISKENKQAIARYVEKGGAFALSTGRLPSAILARARELGLSGMVSCCQGAIILDIQTQEVILEGRLSYESTLKACQKMESLRLPIHLYDLWEYYANYEGKERDLYEKLTNTKGISVFDRPLSDFIQEKKFRAYKLLAIVSPEDSDRVMKLLGEEKIEGCDSTKSAEFLVEMVNAEYSKGTAVEYLANYYKVPLNKVIAVGDQRNDLPMIERAGLGIAVANADEALKEKAGLVLKRTNEENAIAQVIKIALGEEEEYA